MLKEPILSSFLRPEFTANTVSTFAKQVLKDWIARRHREALLDILDIKKKKKGEEEKHVL